MIRATLLDRVVASLSPARGVERLRARAAWNLLSGGYTGARTDRRATKDWMPGANSADADIIGDLPTLRARAADLERNAPLATGAINTVVTNVVGTGLVPYPRIDRELLGLSEDEADAWESIAKRIWRYVSRSRSLDVAGRLTFAEQTSVALRSLLVRGDVLILRRFNADAPYLGTQLQLVEADRVANPYAEPDRPGFAAGVETDADGRILRFHVSNRHPLERGTLGEVRWKAVPALGAESGEPLAWLAGTIARPGQTRAVPLLGTVIEPLKQIDRAGDAELMATVISSLFTAFIKSDLGDGPFGPGESIGTDSAGKALPPEYKLGPGAIGRLLPGEDVVFSNPTRPNNQLLPFLEGMAQQVGAALELPFEILMKRFMASYSASKGAQNEAWRMFQARRQWLVDIWCQPSYEMVITESVARGYLDAPGFFEDALVRQAWCATRWSGPSKGQIDEVDEVTAAKLRVDGGFSTIEDETLALTGGDWEENHRQQVKERRARERDGLDRESVAERVITQSADQRDAREQRGEDDRPSARRRPIHA